MADESVDPQLLEQLKKLQAKYNAMGQDLSSYLDGLLYSDYLTYWDYIHVDTLLSLQTPKTRFPDEKVFILYHQITELYFRLVLHEIQQIAERDPIDDQFFIERIDRILRYFRHLVSSFEIMGDGMEKEQFLKYRMALLPASGFQSAQYRLIEMGSTDIENLVTIEDRESLHGAELPALLDKLYWRSGATELATGKKTLTLQQFEEKYKDEFRNTAIRYRYQNLRQVYLRNFSTSPRRDEIIRRLREYDELANVLWRLAHLRSSARYLQRPAQDIQATGGTNWQKYLPPRFQKVMFFPELWSAEEKEEWGKAGVVAAMS